MCSCLIRCCTAASASSVQDGLRWSVSLCAGGRGSATLNVRSSQSFSAISLRTSVSVAMSPLLGTCRESQLLQMFFLPQNWCPTPPVPETQFPYSDRPECFFFADSSSNYTQREFVFDVGHTVKRQSLQSCLCMSITTPLQRKAVLAINVVVVYYKPCLWLHCSSQIFWFMYLLDSTKALL